MKTSRELLGRIELRRAQRYRLNAPVEYEWADGAVSTQREEGAVRDISISGVYVEANRELPPVGTQVQLEIFLPKYSDPGTGMRLHGEGYVLRVRTVVQDADSERRGFAASLQFYPEPSADDLLGL